MISPNLDALIVGGGPGGSSAATFLARAGKKVMVLEKEIFPRFHVGESLLPYNRPLFEEMGVLPALQAAGFPRKVGAQFHLGNGLKHQRFVFSHGKFTREPETFQVERSRFDHLLLQHARNSGADVREGWSVRRFDADPDGVSVSATDPQDQPHGFRASFLIDASGRSNLTGNQEGLRQIHPKLKKLALFGHFEGVQRDTGERGGDTVIVRLEDKWFWIIPISERKTSVGLVMDQSEFQKAGKTPDEVFRHWIEFSPLLRRRMKTARPVEPLRKTSDFSYHNRRFFGPRLLRVGDAAGFMDPIFSAGVYLAMHSGKLAAEAVGLSLDRGDNGAGRFAAYERRLKRSMRLYWRMVDAFYTTPFMEVFMEPRDNLDMPSAVNAILAGELEGGWAMRWRLEVFFLLVRLQARWPLLPRISFQPLLPRDPGHKPVHETL